MMTDGFVLGRSDKERTADSTVPVTHFASASVLVCTEKENMPLVTTQVRRSPRQNKYGGFKVNMVTDAKKAKSRVKPRKTPRIVDLEEKGEKNSSDADETDIPPPTPLGVRQHIGVQLCGVPSTELSPKKLLASLQDEENVA
jgi:hypothetical protein